MPYIDFGRPQRVRSWSFHDLLPSLLSNRSTAKINILLRLKATKAGTPIRKERRLMGGEISGADEVLP